MPESIVWHIRINRTIVSVVNMKLLFYSRSIKKRDMFLSKKGNKFDARWTACGRM